MRRRRKFKQDRKFLIFGIAFLLCFLSIGYAAFSANISINVRGNTKLLDVIYVSSSGSDSTGTGSLEKPYLTVQKAYSMAARVAKIYVMDDISISSIINMNSDKKITITSYSTNDTVHSLIKSVALNSNMIYQTKGTLFLRNIILDGNEISDTSSGIQVRGSKIVIDDGTEIKKFVSSSSGGGLLVASNSELIMNGGKIFDNVVTDDKVGGAFTIAGSVFNFSGGIIENNEARAGGAIRASGNATINMVGGIIRNNVSRGAGGAIELYAISFMNITGGEIYSNIANGTRAGGINVDCANSTMEECPTLTISGGIIRNNTAASYGGGVSGDPNRLGTIIYNSGIICENTPSNEYDTSVVCPS